MSYHEIYNVQTGELTRVDLTPEEIAEREAVAAQQAAEAIEAAEREAARQALLDRLGITADEAKLLLG